MATEEELEAMTMMVDEAIRAAVPEVLEAVRDDGQIDYQVAVKGTPTTFCQMRVQTDALELGFPQCPEVEDPDDVLELERDGRSCHLRLWKRGDIPDKILGDLFEAAARDVASA